MKKHAGLIRKLIDELEDAALKRILHFIVNRLEYLDEENEKTVKLWDRETDRQEFRANIKKWVVSTIITLTTGAIVGYILSQIGLGGGVKVGGYQNMV